MLLFATNDVDPIRRSVDSRIRDPTLLPSQISSHPRWMLMAMCMKMNNDRYCCRSSLCAAVYLYALILRLIPYA